MKKRLKANMRPSFINRLSIMPGRKTGLHAVRAIPLVLLFLAIVFILYPVMMLVIGSFTDTGTISIAGYSKAFSSSATYKALLNTLLLVLGTLIGTWSIGGMLAFIRHKTDYKHDTLLDACVFLSFTIPAYILSISWIEVVGRGGYLHRILQAVFPGISYGINGYSIGAASFVLALHLYPLVYYGVGNALKLFSGSLEHSARVCGAKKSSVLFTVILPLVMPSFISTGLLVVSRSMANYSVPAQLSSTVGEAVLTTRIFGAMSDLDLSVVSVLSLLLIAISFTLFLLSERMLKSWKYDIAAPAQSGDPYRIKLEKWRKPVDAMITIFFAFTIVIPCISIIFSSFFKRWGLDLHIDNLTLGNYGKLFTQENLLTRPLLNSLFFGITAATVAAIFASLTVYFYMYKRNALTKWLISIAQLPIAIPNMILAVAAMFAWINEPFKLYGTGAIIIVTYTMLFIPICIKQMMGAVKNLDPAPDLAAQTMGIGLMTRYVRLFIPQIRSSLLAGFIICFLISLKEIPISLLLYAKGTQTLGVMMFTIQSNSYGLEMTSAVSVVVIALSVAGNLILRRFDLKGYGKYE
jgi:iron(III) transport system permease protein